MDSGTLLTRWTNYSGDFRGATAPLGSFPQTTSSPPISTRRVSIFITPVGPAPLNPRPNSHSSDGLSFKETASRLSLPVSRFRQPEAPSRRTKSARSASSSTICRCSMPLTITWCSVPGLSSLACLGISSPRIPIPYAICPVSQQRPHALCGIRPDSRTSFLITCRSIA